MGLSSLRQSASSSWLLRPRPVSLLPFLAAAIPFSCFLRLSFFFLFQYKTVGVHDSLVCGLVKSASLYYCHVARQHGPRGRRSERKKKRDARSVQKRKKGAEHTAAPSLFFFTPCKHKRMMMDENNGKHSSTSDRRQKKTCPAKADKMGDHTGARERFQKALGVNPRLESALREVPLSRIVGAFACARCVNDAGRRACRLPNAGQETPGYRDRSLFARCIRSLVLPAAVYGLVDEAMRSGGPTAHGWGHVCADERALDGASDRPTLRLCTPAERDCVRLAAWTWAGAVTCGTPLEPRGNPTVLCWEVVSREPETPSHALVLGMEAHFIDASPYSAPLASVAKMLKSVRRDVNRQIHPWDARIMAAIDRPFWTGDPNVCNVLIDDDPHFAIAAEWR